MLIAGCSDLSRMSPGHVTTDTMRTAFAQYAKTHKAAPIQRCWSTWNVLCCAQSTPVSPRGPAGQGNGAPSVPALPDRILNPPLTDKVRIHPDADIEERRIRVKARHPRGCPGTDEANQPSSSPARQRRSNHPVRASAQEPRRGGLYGGKKGVIGLMRYYATTLAEKNIRVNSVHPTGVATPMIMNEQVGHYAVEHPEFAALMQNLLPVPGLL
jgi:hypothetical protein